MSDTTIVYAVGGHDNHYLNLQKAIRSHERLSEKPKVLIIDCHDKVENFIPKDDNITIRKYEGQVPTDVSQKHLFWRMRYDAYKYVETPYALYADSDTVFMDDQLWIYRILLEDSPKTVFLLTEHFWVPKIIDYINLACGSKYFDILINKLKLDLQSKFYASGAFFWKNSTNANDIFKKVIEMYEIIYQNKDKYIEHMTDEVWLAAALNQFSNEEYIHTVGGCFNHCLEPPMPVILRDGHLEGRNPQEAESEYFPIFLGHCDTFRRNPGWQYGPEINKLCREAFYL